MPDLIVKNITSRYQFQFREGWNLISTQKTAFENISFSVLEGNHLAIVGETGSGKSSLLKCLSGFLPIESGEICWNGIRLDQLKQSKWKSFRKEIQIIFQDPMTAFNPATTIKQSLFNVLNSHFELSDFEKTELITTEMNLLNLHSKLADKQPSQLSGGQLQRFVILRSFLLNPKLVLCDEPTSSLDAHHQEIIISYTGKKCTKLNCSLIWVTHQMTSIKQLCNQILVIRNGQIENFGDIAKLKTSNLTEYSQKLLEPLLPKEYI